ncbi:MAG: DUF5703 domain-containing protein [Armatimonadota bacterium]
MTGGTLVLGSGEFKGVYSRDSGVVFNARPRGECEYMATGTGRTGVAVLAHNQLVLQINSDGSLDEHGWLQVAGRVRLTFEGDPLARAAQLETFRMMHDLRRSVICILADTEQGHVRVEVRAHMERDLIRVDIEDGRVIPGSIGIEVQAPWDEATAVREDVSTPGRITLWHNNSPKTDWHEINLASGMRDDAGFADPLADRCFGMGVMVDTDTPWSDRRVQLAGKTHTTIFIAAAALQDERQFLRSLSNRLTDLPDQSLFTAEHEGWWERFWTRTWFRTDTSMLKHMAAYDFYRYYTAVAAGEAREFPLRFQIDLLRSTLRYDDSGWLQMHINSVQTVEAYYPAYKNGDWDVLASLVRFYRDTLPFFQRFCADYYGHDGAIIIYETNLWGSVHFYPAHGEVAPYFKTWRDRGLYHLDTQLWIKYSFEHGPALMYFLLDAAEAKGDASIIEDVIIPNMREMCRFFLAHYPAEEGKIVFDPATSGETWFAARNPTSWIHLFRSFLPRVIALADRYGDSDMRAQAAQLLEALPEVAMGQWTLREDRTGERVPCDDRDADVFLPAEAFDRHPPINAENPELYGLWPYRALGIGMPNFAAALRTYRGRVWKNLTDGWNLDVIWAARLGLVDEVLHDYDTLHFPSTVRSPAGFSFETAPTWPEEPSLPLYPSMQGMGASVCHIYEMVCQDCLEAVRVLPAWPVDTPVSMAMYSANAGRIEIDYTPGQPPRVKTERPVVVIIPDVWKKHTQ